jgi:hypothetical protein
VDCLFSFGSIYACNMRKMDVRAQKVAQSIPETIMTIPRSDSATRATQETNGILCRLGMFALPKTVVLAAGRSRSSTERQPTKRAVARMRYSDQDFELADLRGPIAREIKFHGKQNADRRHASGGNPGGGAAWQSGRGI